MAQPLKYDVPPARAEQTAREEALDLLETMREHGTLRVLNGFFGQLSEVAEVATKGLDTPGGRNAVGTLLILLKALGQTDPDGVQAALDEVTAGLRRAGRSFREEPPGFFRLICQLGNADVRRGLRAALILLGALGRGTRKQDLPAVRRSSRAAQRSNGAASH